MVEYIEREAAMQAFLAEKPDAHYPGWYAGLLEELPAADVAPVVHARWRQTSKGAVHCSNCGTVCGIGAHIDEVTEGLNFCPNCGARMDGDAE